LYITDAKMFKAFTSNHTNANAFLIVHSTAYIYWVGQKKYPTGQNAVYRRPREISMLKFLDLYGIDQSINQSINQTIMNFRLT